MKRMRYLTFSFLFLISLLLFSVQKISEFHVEAQTSCTPPLYQGYPSACGNLTILWLNRDPISSISRFDIFRYGVKVGEAPANALSFSEPVGCGFGSSYTITQVMKSGATCSVTTTGNAPHTRPCDMCTAGQPVLNVVSSASYGSPVMAESLVTIFANPGETLTSITSSATSLPLPTSLGGTQIMVEDIPAGLVYVSPTQINFLMPLIRPGYVNMVVTGSNGQRTQGIAFTGFNPSIFTADGSGKGVAAALLTSDGRTYQPIFDAYKNAVPISVGNGVTPNYLVLFGTAIRNQSSVQVKINGQNCKVVWSGAHPSMPGLDQINVELPQNLRGVGKSYLTVIVSGFSANFPELLIGG